MERSIDKALLVWASDIDEVAVGVCLRSWSEVVGNKRQRLRREARVEGMLDRAILRWGSESNAMQLHVVVRAWRDDVLRQLLERGAAGSAATAVAAEQELARVPGAEEDVVRNSKCCVLQ